MHGISYRPTDLSSLKEFSKKIIFKDFYYFIWTRLSRSSGSWAMLLFWKLVDETQMTGPRKYTDAFIIIKKLFLGGLRGLQSISKQYERPCKWLDLWSKLVTCFFCFVFWWGSENILLVKNFLWTNKNVFWSPIKKQTSDKVMYLTNPVNYFCDQLTELAYCIS